MISVPLLVHLKKRSSGRSNNYQNFKAIMSRNDILETYVPTVM